MELECPIADCSQKYFTACRLAKHLMLEHPSNCDKNDCRKFEKAAKQEVYSCPVGRCTGGGTVTDFTKNRRSRFKNEFFSIFKEETLGIGKISHFESEKNYSSNYFFKI